MSLLHEKEKFMEVGKVVRSQTDAAPFWRDFSSLAWFSDANFWMVESKARLGACLSPEKDRGYIGWYECIDNDLLAKEMLKHACQWLKEKGCSVVVGPVNGSSWYAYRFNLDNEYPLFPGEPFQPSYYVKQWENFGFEPNVYYHSATVNAHNSKVGELEFHNFLDSKGLSIEYLSMDCYSKYKTQILELLNSCFKVNPLFHPIEMEEFKGIYDPLIATLPKGLSFLLKDNHRQIMGLYVSYPDVYSQLRKTQGLSDAFVTRPRLIVKTAVAHPDWQNQQISSNAVFYLHTKGKEMGMEEAIHATMFHHNVSFKASQKKFAANTCRTYALMEKGI
ncbi:MAG: hypothetical protein MRZ79_11765 [Bacteroidia bacterium]|nr:hypothetical protein [Bacteroidia bacterium]